MEGSFAVDGETWKIDNKVEHNKEHIFPAGNFIVKLTVKPQDKKLNTVSWVVHEKKGNSLVLVTKGVEEDVVAGKTREIYAKGEEGQPNSIIIITLKDI